MSDANPPRGKKTGARLSDAPRYLYTHLRADVGAIWKKMYDGGWRPMLGFVGVYIAHFAYVIAPKSGFAVDYTATNIFLAMVFVQALGRGVEKVIAERGGAAG